MIYLRFQIRNHKADVNFYNRWAYDDEKCRRQTQFAEAFYRSTDISVLSWRNRKSLTGRSLVVSWQLRVLRTFCYTPVVSSQYVIDARNLRPGLCRGFSHSRPSFTQCEFFFLSFAILLCGTTRTRAFTCLMTCWNFTRLRVSRT